MCGKYNKKQEFSVLLSSIFLEAKHHHLCITFLNLVSEQGSSMAGQNPVVNLSNIASSSATNVAEASNNLASNFSFTFNTPIKLDRSNYLLWRSQVLASIRGNQLEKFIDGTTAMPSPFITHKVGDIEQVMANPAHQIWKSQDQILLGWLLSSMTEGSFISRVFRKDQGTMRTPSLIAQCLPGLAPQDRGSHSMSSTISEKDVHLPYPAVEIIPSKIAHPYKYAGDNVDLQGMSILKGRVSVADIIGFTGSEMISSKPDGFLKSWESSIDLVNVLKHEIRDGQLSLRGKRVLELGCSYGLPGIFACLKGACIVHFQDLSAETIRCTTIPNVLANLEQARDRQSRQPESPLTPSRQTVAPSVHFYAGDWEELPTVLSVVKNEVSEVTTGMNLSFSEEDFMDGCSSQDGSIIGQDFSSRQSRKLSGSRAWERASEADQGEGGYDVILMTEIPYSVTTLKKLYSLIKKCLKPPYGVVYLAAKKNYVGFNNAARHLRSLVDEEGIFGVHLIKEMADRDIWKFFLK